MNLNYNLDEKDIFNFFIEESTFNPKIYGFDNVLNSDKQRDFSESPIINILELIIRPECNQQCKYCYITKYGKELYPIEKRISREEILNNVRLILDWTFNTKRVYINHWELFAGDLFYDDLYFDILDIFAEFLREKVDQYPLVFKKYPGLILTPCNFSFIHSQEKIEKLEQYMEQFDNEFNWDLGFSISTDGKYGIDAREQIPLPDDHFDKLFKWSLDHPAVGFHSIISVDNIDNSIKNYQWWKKQCEKWFKGTGKEDRNWLPYWLQARQDEWTQESIDKMLQLLDYMVVDRYHMCGDDPDKLALHLFGETGDIRKAGLPSNLVINDLIRFSMNNPEDMTRLACSINHATMINVSNLSFVPCHRLAYEMFQGGNFIVENNKIIDIEPFNPITYLITKIGNAATFPVCTNCVHNVICDKGCLGAQFESSGEIFLPIESVCLLRKEMNNFLLWKYYYMGVIDSAIQQNLLGDEIKKIFAHLLEEMRIEDKDYGYIEQRNAEYVKQSV